MADIYNTVKTFLLADAGVAALVSTRIYIDVGLPPGYVITDGDAITFHPTGSGGRVSTQNVSPYYVVTNDLLVFFCWSTTAQGAIDLNEALFEAFRVTNNPAEATSFYASPTNRGRMVRAPGDMIAMMSSYEVADIL